QITHNTSSIFFIDHNTPKIYSLSLHDALPIWTGSRRSSRTEVRPRKASRSWTASACTQTWSVRRTAATCARAAGRCEAVLRTLRSEEHTSELQSRSDLVCRLLLVKKSQQLTTQ